MTGRGSKIDRNRDDRSKEGKNKGDISSKNRDRVSNTQFF
jgi:hypothetical protein